MISVELINILQLGLGFLLIFTAFQSCSNIQEFVIQNIASQHSKSGEESIDAHAGYYSLAIIYGVLTVFNFVSPFVVTKLSSKWSMVIGSLSYVSFLASFLRLSNWLFYTSSALLGVGAALIWVGQGSYLAQNSNEETVSRNSGIFWALLQCSLPIGGLFVYTQLKSDDQGPNLSTDTVTYIYASFTGLALLGCLVLLLLRQPVSKDAKSEMQAILNALPSSTRGELVISAEHLSQQVDSVSTLGAVDSKPCYSALFEQLCRVCKLATTAPMILLTFVFVFTGFELTFWSGVYGTAVANTLSFSTPSKQLLALNTICIGFGEILGGGLFGIFGARLKFSRNLIILLACVVHLSVFFIILMNIPAESPFKPTNSVAYMHPNEYLALFCSLLVGFGDACWNTQIYSLLASLYANDSAPAFGLFKMFQSGAACIAFFFGAHLLLHWQLLVLAVLAPIAAVAFF